MSDDDTTELLEVRESIRVLWTRARLLGKDPLATLTWGPDVERFDHLLRALAMRSGVVVAELPWTNGQRHEADELCRSAGVLDGPPLLPPRRNPPA